MGTAAFAQKFRNYGVYKSGGNPGVDSRFTYLYIADQGYIDAGAADNYYVTKEFTNNSTKNAEWKTDTANLIFTGPGRKPFKTGSADNGTDGFDENFAWGSLEIEVTEVSGSSDIFMPIRFEGLRPSPNKKITNLFGYCGTEFTMTLQTLITPI